MVPALTSIQEIVTGDLLRDDLSVVARHVAKLSASRRALLVRRCRSALRQRSVVRHTHTHVAVCKILCAAAPDSATVIRKCLEPGRGIDRCEVQFTLFCFLDRVPSIPRARRFARTLPALIEQFLMNVPAETGRAAWMAGQVLCTVLATGRYKAGRRAAEMALKDLLSEGVPANVRRRIQLSLKSTGDSE